MTKSKRIAGLLFGFGIAAGLPTSALAETVTAQVARGLKAAPFVPNEVLVTFAADSTAQTRRDVVASLGDRSMNEALRNGGVLRVKLAPGRTVAQAIARYRTMPGVRSAQPNYIYHAAVAPSDPEYGQLWAFNNVGQNVATGTYVPTTGTPGDDMNIEPAWDHITDCSSVVVAVVDTGVNYNQEDLSANMWNGNANHGWDFVGADSDPMDLSGHGTHVAGIIGAAGNNGTGAAGVCWKASIMAVRVLNSTGEGTTADIIQGVEFAVANGAKVINMSLGGGGVLDPLFSDAITAAQGSDVVVVAAAGNETNDNDTLGGARYPCNFTQPNLICVAALDQNYALASFSNWGATSVDVAAPGTNILSAWAGAHNTKTDDFNNGAVPASLDWTTSGGWDYKQLMLAGTPVDTLVNPDNFPAGTYGDGVDNRVYKSFDLSGNDVAIFSFFTQIALQANDSFNIGYETSGGDPFAGGGVLLDTTGGVAVNSGGVVGPVSYDVSACIGAACSLGFQLMTDPSGNDQGVGILGFTIETLKLNTNTYNTISGTSMATPETAGVAAMLRAFNPQYTYADTLNAIKNAGRSIAALAGKTVTGKAVDAMGALGYINPPTGVTAAIVP